RPLPEQMLHYGAQDTFFLPGLFQTLTQELREKNRLEWHEECCDELVKATARSKEIDMENMWRIDGSARLSPRQLAALQYLWKFRDKAARDLDLRSYRILPSDALMRFPLAVPPEGDPTLLPTLPSRLSQDLKDGFWTAYEDALDSPPESWPQPLKPVKKTAPSPNANLLSRLKAVRDDIAGQLAIDPSLLATKSTLSSVAL